MQWKIFHLVSKVQITKEQDHENNCLCSLQHDKHVQLCRLSIVLFSVDRKYRHNVVSCKWIKKELLRNIKSRVHGGERALNINALFGSLQQRMLEECNSEKKTKKKHFYGLKTIIFSKAWYLLLVPGMVMSGSIDVTKNLNQVFVCVSL